VLLVVQGGRGTFNTILTTWSNHTPCVLVRESRGCARALADFALKVQEHPEREPGSVELWASLLHEQLEQWDVLKVPPEKVEEAVRLLLPSLSHTPAPHTLDKRTLRDLMIVFSMGKAESLETSILNAVVASCKLRTDADIERRKLARRAVKVPQPVGSLEQPAKPPVHLKARDRDRYVGADCPEGVRRLAIADEGLVPWEADWTAAGGYHPPTYEHPVLTKFCNHGATREERRAHAKAKWADPPAPLSSDLIAEVLSRKTYEMKGVLLWDHEKRLPLNPRGRTGLAGRGLLGKWGPNHAADPIVTRLHPTTNQLQMVAIERADQPGVWALPGGMVDEGETVSETVQREFRAEVGNIPDPEGQRLFEEATGRLFASGGTVVYRGYVDDPRTTDHAWIETTAFHFHCPPEIGAPLASNLGPISPPISPAISA
jgi:ADP-ribose pyrophosphatase